MDSLKDIADPNESYHKCLKIFSSLYKKYFPLTKVKVKLKWKESPSIINGIGKLSKRKQKLYEKVLKQNTPENKETYKAYKSLFEMIKRKSKKKVYSEKLISSKVMLKKHGALWKN